MIINFNKNKYLDTSNLSIIEINTTIPSDKDIGINYFLQYSIDKTYILLYNYSELYVFKLGTDLYFYFVTKTISFVRMLQKEYGLDILLADYKTIVTKQLIKLNKKLNVIHDTKYKIRS